MVSFTCYVTFLQNTTIEYSSESLCVHVCVCVHSCLCVLLRLVICNRLVNLGISKQQHLYLKTKNLIKNTNLTKSKRLRYVTLTGLIWVQCVLAS